MEDVFCNVTDDDAKAVINNAKAVSTNVETEILKASAAMTAMNSAMTSPDFTAYATAINDLETFIVDISAILDSSLKASKKAYYYRYPLSGNAANESVNLAMKIVIEASSVVSKAKTFTLSTFTTFKTDSVFVNGSSTISNGVTTANQLVTTAINAAATYIDGNGDLFVSAAVQREVICQLRKYFN
jgi:hypothetical protein